MGNKQNIPQESGLMKAFEKSIRLVKSTLEADFGIGGSEELIVDARRYYAEIIPQIPFIGDRNPLTIFLLPATRYLAVYRAMQDRGRTVEETGQLVYQIGQAEFERIPALVRRVISSLWFSNWFKNRLRRRAESSHERAYPTDYVLDFVEGTGQEFDYGVDYIECAACKFLQRQNAPELTPYACAIDKLASEMLGWGLVRTTTLAEGGQRCDFRFTKGGKTDVAIPSHLM
jgi:hypothetical protein